MNVWVFNQFAGSPFNSSGAGERFHFIAQHLKRNHQIDVTIFAASFNHLFIHQPRTTGVFTIEYIEGVRYCWVKVPRYSPESGVGRLMSWMIFMLRLFFIPGKRMLAPDQIIVSSMSMFPIYPALIRKFFSKGKIKKVIFEIRDIWPLTLMEMGGFSRYHPALVLLNMTEWVAYRFADHIISVLPFAEQHVQSKMKLKISVTWIPNGIDIDRVKAVPSANRNWKERFGNKILVTYAGAVGTANALEYFLEAHEKLKDPSRYIFLILGTGPELDRLKDRFKDNSSLVFAGKIPKLEVHDVLCQSDFLFIGWHKLSIYRFGVSANKYSDYMLARRPIISSGELAYDPVREAGCGVVVEAENATKIAEAIDYLSELPAEAQNLLGEKGYQYLLLHNSMEVLSEKFYALIKS